MAVSKKNLSVLVLLAIMLIAIVYLFYQNQNVQSEVSSLQNSNVALQGQLQFQTVELLAYQHWAAIGSKNLTATMADYGVNSTLTWVDSPSSPLNGTYTGITAIQSTWTKFFKANPTTYYVIYNYTETVNGNNAVVKATLWYVLMGGKVTLRLPYGLVYSFQSGKWVLIQEYWGLPNDPGTFAQGIQTT